MKTYYFIEDTTFHRDYRLVDNIRWLDSIFVKLIEAVEAERLLDAMDYIEKKYGRTINGIRWELK